MLREKAESSTLKRDGGPVGRYKLLQERRLLACLPLVPHINQINTRQTAGQSVLRAGKTIAAADKKPAMETPRRGLRDGPGATSPERTDITILPSGWRPSRATRSPRAGNERETKPGSANLGPAERVSAG